METLLTAISTVGFPIVMSLVLMKYLKEMQDTHSDDIKEMTKAINNNTSIMNKMLYKLGDSDD